MDVCSRTARTVWLLLIIWLPAREAAACDCLEGPDDMIPEARLTVVAEATVPPAVIEVDPETGWMPGWVTLFRVTKVIVGELPTERIAVEHDLATSCGVWFELAERYLMVFWHPPESDGPVRLSAFSCSVRRLHPGDPLY